jgi:hypothetical protein
VLNKSKKAANKLLELQLFFVLLGITQLDRDSLDDVAVEVVQVELLIVFL